MSSRLTKLRWQIRRMLRQSWVRVGLFALLGVGSAVAGFLLKGFIPADLPAKIGADAIEAILQVLASSMLAVTTFSLSILTASFAQAGGNSSPRAVRLLVEDGTSQTVLATFLGAFLFSLVSIILLKTGIYGEAGRLILFGVTVLVTLVVVVSLLGWINKMGQLGRVGDTMIRVSRAAEQALADRLADPWLGGNPLHGGAPDGTVPVMAARTGFIQHLNVPSLSAVADRHELQVFLTAQPGDFLHPARSVVHVSRLPQDREAAAQVATDINNCFTLDDIRSFDQDPRFGLIVLSEIAQRALSPGINDPGTARLAVAQIVRVLGQWTEETAPDIQYARLWVPSLTVADMLHETVLPIARDGAADVMIQRSVQEALLALVKLSPQVFASDCSNISQLSLEYAESGLILESQREELRRIAGQIRAAKS